MIDIKMKNTCQIVLKDYKKGKKKFTLTIEFIGNPLKVATAACLFFWKLQYSLQKCKALLDTWRNPQDEISEWKILAKGKSVGFSKRDFWDAYLLRLSCLQKPFSISCLKFVKMLPSILMRQSKEYQKLILPSKSLC